MNRISLFNAATIWNLLSSKATIKFKTLSIFKNWWPPLHPGNTVKMVETSLQHKKCRQKHIWACILSLLKNIQRVRPAFWISAYSATYICFMNLSCLLCCNMEEKKLGRRLIQKNVNHQYFHNRFPVNTSLGIRFTFINFYSKCYKRWKNKQKEIRPIRLLFCRWVEILLEIAPQRPCFRSGSSSDI